MNLVTNIKSFYFNKHTDTPTVTVSPHNISESFNDTMSLNDVTSTILDKLIKYAVNLPDPTCIDYLNADITTEEKQTRGKKKKVIKITGAMTDDEFRNLPESSWSRAVKNTC